MLPQQTPKRRRQPLFYEGEKKSALNPPDCCNSPARRSLAEVIPHACTAWDAAHSTDQRPWNGDFFSELEIPKLSFQPLKLDLKVCARPPSQFLSESPLPVRAMPLFCRCCPV